MSTSGNFYRLLAALAMLAVSAIVLAGALVAHGDVNPPIFLTRLAGIITTYPRNVGFSVGTTSPSTTIIGKLNVTLLPSDAFVAAAGRDTFRKAFQVSSTTTAGGTATSTADIFSVYRTGCVGIMGTSTATPLKIVLVTGSTTATATAGLLGVAFGVCS